MPTELSELETLIAGYIASLDCQQSRYRTLPVSHQLVVLAADMEFWLLHPQHTWLAGWRLAQAYLDYTEAD